MFGPPQNVIASYAYGIELILAKQFGLLPREDLGMGLDGEKIWEWDWMVKRHGNGTGW